MVTIASRKLTALAAVGAILAVNGLVLGPMWLVIPGAFSATVASPAYVISQQVSWVLLTVLIVLVPVLAVAGRKPLPEWVVLIAQLALAAQAALHFTQGFVLPWLAAVAPAALDIVDGGSLQLVMLVIQIVFLIVMVTVAVALWRAGNTRTGAVLMMLGALVIPGVGPIGAGVLGLGLLVIAVGALRRGARSRDAVQAEQPTVAAAPLAE